MLRLIGILLMVFGGFMWLVGLFGLTLPNQNFRTTFILLLTGAPFIASDYYLYKGGARTLEEKENVLKELPEIKNADYKHIFGDTAIALNKSTQTLF